MVISPLYAQVCNEKVFDTVTHLAGATESGVEFALTSKAASGVFTLVSSKVGSFAFEAPPLIGYIG